MEESALHALQSEVDKLNGQIQLTNNSLASQEQQAVSFVTQLQVMKTEMDEKFKDLSERHDEKLR